MQLVLVEYHREMKSIFNSQPAITKLMLIIERCEVVPRH